MLQKYGLHLIRLDLPFRLNHVNCFMAEGENGWIVIDTGLHNRETAKRWNEILEDKDVSDIIVTHEHPDHIGYSGILQKQYGARVHMTKVAYESGLRLIKEERLSELKKNYKLSGVPTHVVEELLKANENMKNAVNPLPHINNYLDEGDIIQIGNYPYEVIFTPGHSDGLITLYNKEEKILISTDHILPKITPNISYWFHGDPNPLKSYLLSLDKIRALDAHLVIPSHRIPFYDANKRIDEIKAHHNERLEETLAILKSGGTVYELTQKMFHQSLTSHEMRFAIGEAIAHLEYLRHAGECVREMRDGQWWYSLKYCKKSSSNVKKILTN